MCCFRTSGEGQHTFYVVCQKHNLGWRLSKLGAYLIVGSFVHLGASVDGIVVGREQRLDVSGLGSIFDVGKELELCLHAAGREDGQGFASSFPSF